MVFALLIPFHVLSLNFSSTFLRLNCPERGLVEVILHVYDHTQERKRRLSTVWSRIQDPVT